MAVKSSVHKNCLTVGRWIATNMDTGETTVVVRFGTLERRYRKEKFVRKHAKLCAKAYAENCCWSGRLNKTGHKLVAKGRAALDYSDKTTTGDVYHLIMCGYRNIFKPGPRRNCTCGYCKRMSQ